ncbi:hypothetical protein AXF42_Ash018995 [Apostasia shenzhenica]|uniref:Uncharacterized protein n=1 Tax=Apostasia shenzhenica TaxID=1088818 RepID=A0A2I0AC15_9ASPA|nr:hypothetical protein AXF42_Ash018995 [Apostasia shenzhenica]
MPGIERLPAELRGCKELRGYARNCHAAHKIVRLRVELRHCVQNCQAARRTSRPRGAARLHAELPTCLRNCVAVAQNCKAALGTARETVAVWGTAKFHAELLPWNCEAARETSRLCMELLDYERNCVWSCKATSGTARGTVRLRVNCEAARGSARLRRTARLPANCQPARKTANAARETTRLRATARSRTKL